MSRTTKTASQSGVVFGGALSIMTILWYSAHSNSPMPTITATPVTPAPLFSQPHGFETTLMDPFQPGAAEASLRVHNAVLAGFDQGAMIDTWLARLRACRDANSAADAVREFLTAIVVTLPRDMDDALEDTDHELLEIRDNHLTLKEAIVDLWNRYPEQLSDVLVTAKSASVDRQVSLAANDLLAALREGSEFPRVIVHRGPATVSSRTDANTIAQ